MIGRALSGSLVQDHDIKNIPKNMQLEMNMSTEGTL